MPKNNKTEQEIEQEELEKQGRINALTQLLANTQKDIILGYEGLMPQAEYEELKENRRLWFEELATLNGEEAAIGQNTLDVYEFATGLAEGLGHE